MPKAKFSAPIAGMVYCPACNGYGKEKNDGNETCIDCNGTGSITIDAIYAMSVQYITNRKNN